MRMFEHFFVSGLAFSCVVLSVKGQYNYNNNWNSGQYQNYPVDTYAPSTCNDLRCSPNECCVETHRAPVCVALVAIASGGQAFCARYKKCSNLGDCPASAPCCVQALEPSMVKPFPPSQAYGQGSDAKYYNSYISSYSSSYSFSSSYGYDNYIDRSPLTEGYCQARATTGGLCYSPLRGSEAYNCPCTAPDTCIIALEPFVTGLCTTTTTTTTTTIATDSTTD